MAERLRHPQAVAPQKRGARAVECGRRDPDSNPWPQAGRNGCTWFAQHRMWRKLRDERSIPGARDARGVRCAGGDRSVQQVVSR